MQALKAGDAASVIISPDPWLQSDDEDPFIVDCNSRDRAPEPSPRKPGAENAIRVRWGMGAVRRCRRRFPMTLAHQDPGRDEIITLPGADDDEKLNDSLFATAALAPFGICALGPGHKRPEVSGS